MSKRSLDRFFELLAHAQRSFFPDLFFRGHRVKRPLVINTPAIECRYVRLRLDDQCLHLEQVEILGGDGDESLDLTGEALLHASSVYPGTEAMLLQRTLFSRTPKHLGVHTGATPGGWVDIELPSVSKVKLIRVHNRDDAWAWRAWGLCVDVSLDGERWEGIYSQRSRLDQFVSCVSNAVRHNEWAPNDFVVQEACCTILKFLVERDFASAGHVLDRPECRSLARDIRKGFNENFLVEFQRAFTSHGVQRTFRYWSFDEKRAYLDQALQLLADLQELTESVCFGFGFVLGCVRNGELIPHDDDVDLIISFERTSVPTISRGLELIGQHLRQLGYEVLGDDLFNHRWVKKPGWRTVDVFVGLREKDGVAWFPSERRPMAWDDVFPPAEVDMYGLSCPVPRNPLRYLERTYGPDWRKPDSNFNHPWDRDQYHDIA